MDDFLCDEEVKQILDLLENGTTLSKEEFAKRLDFLQEFTEPELNKSENFVSDEEELRILKYLELSYYLKKFRKPRKKPNATLAQTIWLFCHDNDIDVPEDVLKIFVSKIRKIEEDKEPSKMKQKVQADFLLLHEIELQKRAGRLLTDIFDELSGEKNNGSAIKQWRWRRTKSKQK